MYSLIYIFILISVTSGYPQNVDRSKAPRAIHHQYNNFGPYQFRYKDSNAGNSKDADSSDDYIPPRLVVRGKKGENSNSTKSRKSKSLPELNSFKYEPDEQGRGGTYRYRFQHQPNGNGRIFHDGPGNEKQFSYQYGSGGTANEGIPAIRRKGASGKASINPDEDEKSEDSSATGS